MTEQPSALKVTPTTVLEVDHGPLECLVTRHYGRPYSVISALEARSGTYYKVTVAKTYRHYDPDAEPGARFSTRDGLDPEAEESVRAWLDGGTDEPGLDELLHDLACSDVIPTGDYLIHVFW